VINPTAVIAPQATLGTNVTIGPYAVIGPEVTLGDDVEIAAHAVLEGRVELGPRVRVGPGAMLGGEPQDFKFKRGTPSGVRVGAGTVIREYATIHRATHAETWTEIGAECLIMGSAHVAHDCRVGDHVIMINFAGLTGHCEVGDRATIGGLTGIAPFTRIGTFAYIGGLAKVTRDCPPFMIADGHPATVRAVNVIGLRRAGVGPAERRALRDAHRVLYRLGLTPAAALDRLRREAPPIPQIKELITFLETAKRGTLGAPGSEESRESEEEDD
jgi:UDP-N-acetylglucosamine acyltransferase